jgi:hypothetical protein
MTTDSAKEESAGGLKDEVAACLVTHKAILKILSMCGNMSQFFGAPEFARVTIT